MRRIPIYISTFLLAATSFSCSQQEDFAETTQEKEQVLFCAGISSNVAIAQTKASTGGESGFQSTSTKMKLYAQATGTGQDSENVTRVVEASVSAIKGSTGAFYNEVSAPLYWDEFGAGDDDSKVNTEGLSIYGVAIDGYSVPSIAFEDLSNYSVSVVADQSASIADKDLLISNNISNSNTYKYNKETNATNPAELIFKHAFCKITINFKKGNGFTTDEAFTANFIHLPGYNVSGILNIKDGTYTNLTSGTIEETHQQVTTEGYNLTYEALTLPGRNFNSAEDALIFDINGNIYTVKTNEIYNRLPEMYRTMNSGVNYTLNITVNKTDTKAATYVKCIRM